MAPRTAIVLGGTGLLGSAVARHLVDGGWDVTVTGRDAGRVPVDLVAPRVRFARADRGDDEALARLVGVGCDLLVDCRCYTADDARALAAVAGRATSTVMLSSKAVYVDADGNHSNGDVHPCFDGPIREDQATMAPGDGPYATREGYGANKVAAEHVLLACGHPVTVLRVSKAHGRGAARPREWVFVRRVLEGRAVVVLADGGRSVDHTCAARNLAALVEVAADAPGARVLNAADPDAPSAVEIARAVAAHLGHRFDEVLLDGDPAPPLGDHPWHAAYPIVLDTAAAEALGYRPVGTFADTVGEEVEWLVELAGARGLDGVLDEDERGWFARFFEYGAEDAHLAALGRASG